MVKDKAAASEGGAGLSALVNRDENVVKVCVCVLRWRVVWRSMDEVAPFVVSSCVCVYTAYCSAVAVLTAWV